MELVDVPFAPAFPGVYLLYRGDEVVYVGRSLNVSSRVPQHQVDKEFDRAQALPCDPEELDTLEALLIYAFEPQYNWTVPYRNGRSRLKGNSVNPQQARKLIEQHQLHPHMDKIRLRTSL